MDNGWVSIRICNEDNDEESVAPFLFDRLKSNQRRCEELREGGGRGGWIDARDGFSTSRRQSRRYNGT